MRPSSPSRVTRLLPVLVTVLALGCEKAATEEASPSQRSSGIQVTTTNACYVPFTSTANVSAPACGSTWATMDNCYNDANPPLPSVLRNYKAPQNPTNRQAYTDSGAIAFPSGVGTSTDSLILPTLRTSNDGRLVLAEGRDAPVLGVFLPENVNHDLKQNASASRKAARVSGLGLHPFLYFNPLDTRLPVHVVGGQVTQMPPSGHQNLCEDSGSGFTTSAPQLSSKRNPRRCDAQYTSSDVRVAGDCYDITLHTHLTGCTDPTKNVYDGACPGTKWEIRTTDLTVFVPNAKRAEAGTWGATTDTNYPVWIYPRMTGSSLPPFSSSDPAQSYNAHAVDWTHYDSEARRCYVNGVPPQRATNAPKWCGFLYSQKHSPLSGFFFDGDGDAADDPVAWDGASNLGWMLFEPATTGDGRLLIVNGMQAGLMYSYSSQACDASQWTTFKPLSRMMRDPAVQTRYELTRAQMLRDGQGNLLLDTVSRANARLFRDTMGQPIPEGSPIPGAYLWIDRQGKNAIFSHAPIQRDGYRATRATGYCPDPTDENPDHCVTSRVTFTSNTTNDKVLNPDRTNGKGQTLLGAWTQGKLVHLDNALNPTDWGGRGHWFGDRYEYDLSLYGACDSLWQPLLTRVRPKHHTTVFSLENQLNHFDPMNPNLPFDVVWRAQGNGNNNAEIVFDDYLRNNALVVAHMNPAIDIRCADGSGADTKCTGFNFQSNLRFSGGLILDGFVANNSNWWANASQPANARNDSFAVDPTLQNAATSDPAYKPGAISPPSTLRLRGGARVEPINAGGVLGRGVYLDGQNDIVDMAYPYQSNRTEWWAGVWLDSRDLSTLRTVFFFPDESSIALKNDRIVAHDGPRTLGGHGGNEQSVMLPAGLLQEGRFFHLAVKLTTENDTRVLRFSINGTPLAQTLSFSRVYSMQCIPTGFGKCTWMSVAVPFGFQFMKSGQSNGYTWFALAGCTTDWNPPFKGWVDELKVFALDSAELANSGGFFDELACNQALGTLVDVSVRTGETANSQLDALRQVATRHGFRYPGAPASTQPELAAVCEQLRLTPDGGQGELPAQHSGALLCAHRVHKNPGSDRCVREAKNGMVAVSAQQPLPNFSGNSFCQGCHHSGAQVSGLTPAALAAGSVASEADPRRRPTLWPAAVTGRQFSDPFSSTTPLAGFGVCDPSTQDCTALDRTFNPAGSKWWFP
ncbi:hypothetical protein NR798_05745 [Archangium gephyra]|uniref:hypothetical protein n=1 Tax=Archangium gephyra TaxID=48 RepID=UPI0035D5079D